MRTAYVKDIIEKTARLIARKDAKMADLARFLGKNWNQCHEWLVKKKYEPSAEVVLGMLHFLALHDRSNGEVSIHEGVHYLDGQAMTDRERDLWLQNNHLKAILAGAINEQA